MNSPKLTPSTPPPSTPLSTSRHKTLTRDQSLLIHGFCDAGWSYQKIANHLNVSRGQVAYSLKRGTVTPRKGSGRPSTLSQEDVDQIIEFITSSSVNRRMTYLELATGPFRDLGVSEKVLQKELQKRGYKRHPAYKKPPSSQETMRKRREWAEAHLHWTFEDWSSILWTDETWVKDGQHSREWVTRKNNEEYQIDCVDSKTSKRNGWMFWGSFAGAEKGPCLFWEKEWGSIDSEKYCEKIVPLIDGMVSMKPWLSVMQDNAPAHACENTMEELQERSIIPIDWTPYSPDLNPIEAVWCWMKDYIQRNYPNLDGGRQRTHNSLRVIVTEAWHSVPAEFLIKLLEGLPARCQAVIDAGGGPTRY